MDQGAGFLRTRSRRGIARYVNNNKHDDHYDDNTDEQSDGAGLSANIGSAFSH